MGTNFYWVYDNPRSEYVSAYDAPYDAPYVLRGAIEEYLDGIIDKEKLRDIHRITGPKPDPVEVTLITGKTVQTDYDEDHPSIHLGKRSAAGLYCYDCHKTLCLGGEDDIHYGRSAWSDVCPECGKGREKEGLGESSVGLELGFSKSRSTTRKGVSSCSSFGWAQDPDKVRKVCEEMPGEIIVDEYGTKMTGKEFLDMLKANCPIQHTRHLGEEFC